MPQFQVLQGNPGFGEQLGKALGGGIGAGVNQGIGALLTGFQAEKSRISKGRQSLPGTLNTIFKQLGADKAFDETKRKSALDRSLALLEEGYDPVGAALKSYEEMITPSQEEQQKQATKPSVISKALGELESGTLKGLRPLVGIGQLPIEALHFLEKGVTKGAGKVRELLGLSPEVPKMAGLDKFLPEPINPFKEESPLQKFDIATQGKGIPEDTLQRIVAGYPVGPAGIIGNAAEEAALGLGLPEQLAPLANLAGLGFGAAIQRPLLNAAMRQASRLPSFKAVEKTASSLGTAPEKIVEEATSNLAKRGVDVAKIAEGDPATLKALDKEIRKTSDVFKETEVFHKKEALKRRAEVGEKLKESPLEKYYAPKEKGPKTPEGIATEELRISPLRERASALESRAKDTYRSILNTEAAIRESTGRITQEQMARLKASKDLARLEHSRVLNELRNTEFEMKHRRPPATTEEIGKQIDKSFAELREGIKNPTAEKLQKVRAQLEKDKSAIDTAKKLVERGEIPGPEVFDEYIKIHQQYNKAYGDLIGELGDFVKNNQNIAEMKTQVSNARQLKDLIKEMKKSGEAKVVNQIDKRKALRTLEKPSGAFYKQMLKDLKKDVEDFQKSFFHTKNLAHPETVKTAEVAKKPIQAASELKKVAADASAAVKNPTQGNVEKLARDTGASPRDTQNFFDKLREEAGIASKKAESGKFSENDIVAYSKKIVSNFQKFLPELKTSVRNGVVIGALQAIFEEYFGYRPTQTQIGLVAAAVGGRKTGFGIRSGAGAIAIPVYKVIRDAFEASQVEKLKSLRNTSEFNKKRDQLEEKYGKSRANRILKAAIS